MAESESGSGSEANTPIRFGIMGCATIARKIARAISLSPNATLYAVASRSADKARRFAAAAVGPAIEKVYGSYDELLDDPCVDAVYLPLPTSLHLRWGAAAAARGKHLLVEKPAALDAAELDRILEECRSNGVVLMDGTMWLHHPRTLKMMDLISDSTLFGPLNYVYSAFTMAVSPEFLETDIRVKPELDSLGALGDLGWYCIGAALWAKQYQLPSAVQALPDTTKNSAGVILSFTASLHWGISPDTLFNATIHGSFLSHTSMDLVICGSNATIRANDFILPYQETHASFELSRGSKVEEVNLDSDLPQEALMVQEFARLVHGIRQFGYEPDHKWAEVSRKTQLVLDAVKRSIDLGCIYVEL